MRINRNFCSINLFFHRVFVHIKNSFMLMYWKIIKEVVMKSFLTFSAIIRLIGSILLFWALGEHTYGYYSLLRYISFGVGIYLVYISMSMKQIPWAWIFGMIALIFNPLFPVRLERELWAYVDVISGIIFLASIFFVRENLSSK